MANTKYDDNRMEEVLHSIHQKLDEIITQTTKTNGRVGALESWRGSITGGLAVITCIVVPMAFKIMFQ